MYCDHMETSLCMTHLVQYNLRESRILIILSFGFVSLSVICNNFVSETRVIVVGGSDRLLSFKTKSDFCYLICV